MSGSYLYRGKRNDNGTWIQGGHLDGSAMFNADVAFICPRMSMSEVAKGIDGEYRYGQCAFLCGPFHPVDPKTIGQCTGLRDSNNELIYEGDIVNFTYWWFDGMGEADSQLIGEVIYIPELMSYALRGVKNKDWIRHIGGDEGTSDTVPFATWRFDGDDFKIIGNVHDNPELLEVSE